MVNSESNGKVALITGANKGLGLEMSHQLGKHGLTIFSCSRNLAAAEAAATTLQKEGLKVEAIALDVNNSHQIQSADGKLAIASVNSMF